MGRKKKGGPNSPATTTSSKSLVQVAAQSAHPEISSPRSVPKHASTEQSEWLCKGHDQVVRRSSTMTYVVSGIWNGKYPYGATSLSNEHNPSHHTWISILCYKNHDEALRHFWNLKNCRCEYVLEAHFLDVIGGKEDFRVVVDRFSGDITTWAELEYSSWVWSKSPGTISWWEHLVKQGFLQKFRDVLCGLRHIYSLGYFHGILSEGVVVLENGQAKLMNISCPNPLKVVDRNGVVKDLGALKQMILHILLKPVGDTARYDIYHQVLPHAKLEQLFIPTDMRLFLDHLNDEKLVRAMDLDWLLDDAAFWKEKERISFICGLWDQIESQRVLDSGLLSMHLPEQFWRWESKVPREGCWLAILERIEDDEEIYQRQTEMKESCELHELTRYYWHCLEHYNSTLPIGETLSKEDVDKEIHRIFSCPCSGIRFACTMIFREPAQMGMTNEKCNKIMHRLLQFEGK